MVQADPLLHEALASQRGIARLDADRGPRTDRCAALLREMGATIVRGPAEDTWAPGYYSVLFEDPDGIRLEVNFVPGAGLLAEGAQFRGGPPNMG
jgi:hypothetical protein